MKILLHTVANKFRRNWSLSYRDCRPAPAWSARRKGYLSPVPFYLRLLSPFIPRPNWLCSSGKEAHFLNLSSHRRILVNTLHCGGDNMSSKKDERSKKYEIQVFLKAPSGNPLWKTGLGKLEAGTLYRQGLHFSIVVMTEDRASSCIARLRCQRKKATSAGGFFM